jgi:Bacterial DNA-binding protein
MTLTKKQMVREIGRRTRLKNRDVQMMLETLIEVWSTELAEGSGRIELEGLFVLETRQLDLPSAYGGLPQAQPVRRVTMRLSRTLRQQLK